MSDEFPDAGPHATPDQIRAARKRRDALAANEGRKSAPDERRAPDTQTASASDAPRES